MKPYTYLYVGLVTLAMAATSFVTSLIFIEAPTAPLTALLSLFFGLCGTASLIRFFEYRSAAKYHASAWRTIKAASVRPGATIFHRRRVTTITGWGWKEGIKYRLVEDADPETNTVTMRGAYRVHPSNGNAVVLYFPHRKTANRWILKHVVCTPAGQSAVVRQEVYDADELDHDRGKELLEIWSGRYVFGDETADGLKYA